MFMSAKFPKQMKAEASMGKLEKPLISAQVKHFLDG